MQLRPPCPSAINTAAITPDGTKVYVGASNSVSVISMASDNAIATIPIPSSPDLFGIFIESSRPESPAPNITTGSLANGATYLSGGLVPGSWAQVKGTSLSSVARIWNTSDFIGLGSNLQTNLGGVQVSTTEGLMLSTVQLTEKRKSGRKGRIPMPSELG
jgi:YVTN family beta-propeller protein